MFEVSGSSPNEAEPKQRDEAGGVLVQILKSQEGNRQGLHCPLVLLAPNDALNGTGMQ